MSEELLENLNEAILVSKIPYPQDMNLSQLIEELEKSNGRYIVGLLKRKNGEHYFNIWKSRYGELPEREF